MKNEFSRKFDFKEKYDLTDSEFLLFDFLYCEITSTGETGLTYSGLSNDRIGEKIGWSDKKASKYIQSLKNKNLIYAKFPKNGNRQIYLAENALDFPESSQPSHITKKGLIVYGRLNELLKGMNFSDDRIIEFVNVVASVCYPSIDERPDFFTRFTHYFLLHQKDYFKKAENQPMYFLECLKEYEKMAAGENKPDPIDEDSYYDPDDPAHQYDMD